MTVRDSMGAVVQFVYGADSLDPTDMEGKDQPIDFHRIFQHIRVGLCLRSIFVLVVARFYCYMMAF